MIIVCLGHPPSFLQDAQKRHLLQKEDEESIYLAP